MLETTNSPNRRRWLSSAALLTVGTAVAGKSLLKKPQPRPPTVEMELSPPTSHPALGEPLIEHGPPAETALSMEDTSPLTYQEFLSRFALRHIRPEEVIQPHLQTTRGITNNLPPIELWPAMPATLFVADEIRDRLGLPLKQITSAYRNPDYNKVCGGASLSWHTKNCALDLVYEGGTRKVAAIAQELRAEGFFTGGIGIYRTFIHIDTRGYNATWRA